MASNIPKFASFRPKPKAVEEPVQLSGKPDRQKKSDRYERSARKEKGEKGQTSSKDHTSTVNSRDRHIAEKERLPFFVDRRGDRANLTYGSLHSYDTPPYRRVGYGSVLGIAVDQKIDREQSTDKAIFLTGSRSFRKERLLASKHANKDSNRVLRIVRPEISPKQDVESNYISLSSTGKKRKAVDVDSEDDFRSFDHEQKPEAPQSDVESEVEEEAGEVDSETTTRNSALIQQTRNRPEDLQGWLDLIDHQHAMLTLGRSSTDLDTSDKRHLAEIRISLYEQAIRKVGNVQAHQITLHAGLLIEAARVWEESKLTAKWTEVLGRYASSTDLWIKYLNFLQSNFGAFKYEKCRESFQSCLRTLRMQKVGLNPEDLLHILVRLTSMVRDAGYQELALAIWQAVLEFTLLRPADKSLSESLAMFEEFWDSEAARIGEEGARGWHKFDAEDLASLPSTPIQPNLPAGSRSTIDNFGDRELDHMEKLKYPGRTTDDVGDDDPFHLVLFSDVEEYLQVLQPETPSWLVLDAFLCFAQMPPLPHISASRHGWWKDPFLQAQRHGRQLVPSQNSTALAVAFKKYMQSSSQVRTTLEYLFEFAFDNCGLSIEARFMQRILKLLATDCVADNELIGQYLFAFEYYFFPAEVNKTAKQQLKVRPTSLALYRAYGLVESRKGNSSKANLVFSSALSMQKSETPLTIPGSLQLFTSWVWEALREAEFQQALWRLVSPLGNAAPFSNVHNRGPDQVSLLRARTLFTEGKERALLGRDAISAVYFTSLQALLAHLSSSPHNPDAALTIHSQLSHWLLNHAQSQSPAAELHAQFTGRFLLLYTTTTPIVKPSFLRQNLEPLIALFPDNTILLSLYAANESRFAIDDRVRSIINENVLTTMNNNNNTNITKDGRRRSRSIASWLFTIHHEEIRGEIAGSTTHSIRALFRKAEEDDDEVGAHCPLLWTSHVLFELEQLKKERNIYPTHSRKGSSREKEKGKYETRIEEAMRRVKDTFLKGVTKLPWCKRYLMLAFVELRGEGVLSGDELRRVYGVLVEKEVRVYVDVDVDAGS